MGILNFLKDSFFAGFFSEKAFSSLKKKSKVDYAWQIFWAFMIIGFIFMGVLYSFPGMLEQEFSGFDEFIPMTIWFAWVYSGLLTLFSLAYFVAFIFFTKVFLNVFDCVKSKPKSLRELIKPNVIVMIASLVPSLIFGILVGLSIFMSVFNEILAILLVVLSIIVYIVYIFYLYGKTFASIFKINSVVKSALILCLSMIVSYIVFTVILLVLILLLGVIGALLIGF